MKANLNYRSPAARYGLAAVAAAAVLGLSACASSTASSTVASSATGSSATAAGTSADAGSTGTASGSAGVAHAKAQIASHLNMQTTFQVPGGPVTGLAKFKGRTITYIPITLQATYFQAEYAQISSAAALLGIKVQVCNAEAQPTVATQCINQAVAAKSAGIITDSLPFALAQNAYAAAVAANIPVVASDVLDPLPAGWSKDLVATSNGQDVGGRLMADAIIADSGGTAQVLFANTTSTSTTKDSSDAVLNEFSTYCPGCKVTTVNWDPSQVQQIPTAVSVALNANRNIGYVYASYDQPAGPAVVQGMQLSGRKSNLKLVGYGAVVAAMGQIADGSQLADVAVDPAIVAWNNTDRLLRMMAGQPVPAESAYTVPRRAFDSSNISSVDGSSVKDFEDGAWFSNGSFRGDYAKLWGVS